MQQLVNVPARESPSRARLEAIAVLNEQRANGGAFVLSTGAVLVLRFTRKGWRVDYWEVPPI